MRKSLPLFVLIWLLVTSLLVTIKPADAQSDAATPNSDRAKSNRPLQRALCRQLPEYEQQSDSGDVGSDGVDLLPGMDPGWQAAYPNGSLASKIRQREPSSNQCDVDWEQIQVSGDPAYQWGMTQDCLGFRQVGSVQKEGQDHADRASSAAGALGAGTQMVEQHYPEVRFASPRTQSFSGCCSRDGACALRCAGSDSRSP